MSLARTKKILLKEVFVMNTEMMTQFNTIDAEMLSTVEGGVTGYCVLGTFGTTLLGSFGGPVGTGVGFMVGNAIFCAEKVY